MPWDPTPWMVGGGAQHSTNVARNVAHFASGGLEGIATPKACEVRELAVPSTSVRVYPGTVAIINRAAGTFDEVYIGRLPTLDTVPIAATDSTSGRSDLIIARVENPHLDGEPWAAPADPATGPYIFTRVISNVPPGTTSVAQLGLGYSAIALARIDLPASTGTVTQDMITDLRRLAKREAQRDFKVVSPAVSQTITTQWADFPTAASIAVDVPTWATRVKVLATLGGIQYGKKGVAGDTGGELRIAFAGAAGTVYGENAPYNLGFDSADKATLIAGTPGVKIPAGSRGKPATIRVQGIQQWANPSDAGLIGNRGTMIGLDVEFVNDAETNA